MFSYRCRTNTYKKIILFPIYYIVDIFPQNFFNCYYKSKNDVLLLITTNKGDLTMKKWAIILAALAVIGASFGTVNAGPGPAPNSGDGIPDGSGFPSPPSPGPAGPLGK